MNAVIAASRICEGPGVQTGVVPSGAGVPPPGASAAPGTYSFRAEARISEWSPTVSSPLTPLTTT